jgi:hypothetical protein
MRSKLDGGQAGQSRGRGFLAVILVLLVGATCLTALAEAASHTYQVCAAAKGEGVSSSKTPLPNLWAVPIAPIILPPELLPSRHAPLEPAPDLLSAALRGDLASRAPPTLL